jgi:hypothetical protein
MTDSDEQYPHSMTDADEQEPEGDGWHSKITHEDQSELVFPEPGAEPEPQNPPATAAEGESQESSGAVADAEPSATSGEKSAADRRNFTDVPPESQSPFLEVWIPRIQKFLSSPPNFYATVGVGLGILAGIVISWNLGSPTGPYDLGPVTNGGAGLRGRLFTKWDKKLQYRLTIEPSYQEQMAGFSLAAGNSPHPLSVEIHLQDSQGFVLCGKEIVLRFDPRNPVALAASNPEPPAGKTDAGGKAPDNQVAQGIDFAQLETQEAARERGKDIFQNQIGPEGQIESISSQGSLPCSRESYENTTNWSFSTDFPSVAEQDAMMKRLTETHAAATHPPSETSEARRKKVTKPAPNTQLFFIEGDDVIMDYDASTGIIATRGEKAFSIDKTGAEANALKGRNLPLRIHYRCDQTGNCTLTSASGGALHTRLRR